MLDLGKEILEIVNFERESGKVISNLIYTPEEHLALTNLMDGIDIIDSESEMREMLQMLSIKDEDINLIVRLWGTLSKEQREPLIIKLYVFVVVSLFERKILIEQSKFSLKEFLERRHKQKQDNIEHLLKENLSDEEQERIRGLVRNLERRVWEGFHRYQQMLRDGREVRGWFAYFILLNRMDDLLGATNLRDSQLVDRKGRFYYLINMLRGFSKENREWIVNLLRHLFVEMEDAHFIADLLEDLPERERSYIGEGELFRFILTCLIERKALTLIFKR